MDKNTKDIETNELPAHLQERLSNEQEPLPAGIQYRLRAARQQALEGATKNRNKNKHSYWIPGLSFASFAAVIVSVGFFVMTEKPIQTDTLLTSTLANTSAANATASNITTTQTIASIDSDILMEDEDFEFYEDLEFYAWLADNNF